ncbi:histidine phosphatase family protein [Nisaea sp.]|uniref:histidine phosphatase family protein n=1 Tax=Nisaea sp. TaxID=2024842 RepID=UPI002B27274C|nr:histidine phosphatase family protein [Nisaea sp.]
MLFVRHGQSEFNVVYGATGRDPGIEDPALTELGQAQIRHSAEALRGHDVDHIVSSPYRRALETAHIIAEAIDREIRIEPLIREHRHFICDIGRTRTELQADWPHLAFDHIDEQWWTDHHEEEHEVHARVSAFLNANHQRTDWDRVVCVSHWGFINRLTGLPVGNGTVVKVQRDGAGEVVHTPDP